MAGVEIFGVGLIAVYLFLSVCQSLIILKGMDDVRSDKNDDIAFFILFFRLAEQSADERHAAQTRNSGFVLRFRIADHPAQDKEMLVGNMDVGRHVGLCRADPVNGGVAIDQGHGRRFL